MAEKKIQRDYIVIEIQTEVDTPSFTEAKYDWEYLSGKIRELIQKAYYAVKVEFLDETDFCRDFMCDDCDERMGEPMRDESRD